MSQRDINVFEGDLLTFLTVNSPSLSTILNLNKNNNKNPTNKNQANKQNQNTFSAFEIFPLSSAPVSVSIITLTIFVVAGTPVSISYI